MDNLARNAMLAKQANMSYGRWKAMQKPVPIVKAKIPDGWIACEHCGKPFKPKTKRAQRFCDVGCQKQAYAKTLRQRNKEYMREYRARKGEAV